jgi:proline iminopeptidase
MLVFACIGYTQQEIHSTDDGLITTQDGVKIYYQKVGEGAEAVIIPGGMYLSYNFKNLAEDSRTIVFYDQRARGRSQSIDDKSKLGIEFELSDLKSVISHFGFKKVTLIGWSYSGAVVILYALKHPGSVKRIIQIGPIPARKDPYFYQFTSTLSSRRDSSDLSILEDIYEKFNTTGNLETYIKDYYRIAHKALKYNPEIEDRFREDFFTLDNERPDKVWNLTLPAIIESLGNWDFRDDLRKISIPVLTVHGDYDAIPLESAREWFMELPNCSLVVVKDAGHLPWTEKPRIVFHAIESFLVGD